MFWIHTTNLLMFLGGLNLSGRDAQCRGGVLQETEGFSSLGGVICHPGANTFRFLQRLMFSTCRNTLREKYFVCAQHPRFHYFTCGTDLFSLRSFNRKFAFGQDRSERQNLGPDSNCSQKCRHMRTQTAVQLVASCELTLIWHGAS